MRTNYICSIWLFATEKDPPCLLPENCGWRLHNGWYYIKWFDGESVPNDIDCISQQTLPAGDEDSNSSSENSDYSTSESQTSDDEDEV